MSHAVRAPFDDSKIQDNLAALAFQLLEVGSLAGIETFVDFFSDMFVDNTGVDAVASLNELYNAANDKWGEAAGSDLLTGGIASASSSNGGQTPDLAVDDNDGTYWQAVGAGASWWKYDLGAGNAAAANRLTIKNGSANGGINAFTLEGSNNDAAWTQLHAGNCTNDDTLNAFTFANATAYRYYRISVTSTYVGASGNRPSVREISLTASSGFTLVSIADEAEANDPAQVRLVLLIDLNGLAIIVNTDLLGWISIDDGATWESIVLEYKGLDGTGRAIYSGVVAPAAQGDKTIRAKIQVLNSKAIYAKGWAVLWKY